MPRLVGKGIILSRLGGGIGTSGPGEQKLEVDRRRIRKRIDKLKKDLQDLTKHRQTIRKKRRQENVAAIVLVGYTNAGKSTLLNSLTQASQIVRDSLFTTLDPLAKSLRLPNGQKIVISDTVGFLHNLPHHLIEAFKATLEEVKEADLLIHVLDVSCPLVNEHNLAVYEVLKELGADQIPLVTALNKIDLLDDRGWLERLKKDFVNAVSISAKLKENLDALLKEIELHLKPTMTYFKTSLPLKRMDLVDLFYREGRVINIEYTDKEVKIEAELPKLFLDKLLKNKEI
jgi:GTP-binding protein HflX